MNGKPVGFLGVPSSAGAFAPGQETAPAAIRSAGLVDRLEASGVTVIDHGDTEAFRWRPDRDDPLAQNLDAVVRIADRTARRVEDIVAAGQVPLVVGGDCTVGLGTIAGCLGDDQLGVVYFDLHPDLNVPPTSKPGALDWMGMAHALDVEGARSKLRRFGPRTPLLKDEQVHFFGFGPENRTDEEREIMRRRGLVGTPVSRVAAGPTKSATEVMTEFGSQFDRLVVHFDVDIVDFTDLPLSENPGRNEGLAFDDAMLSLATLLRDPRMSGLTITEINPTHGDPAGTTLDRFVDTLVAAVCDRIPENS